MGDLEVFPCMVQRLEKIVVEGGPCSISLQGPGIENDLWLMGDLAVFLMSHS